MIMTCSGAKAQSPKLINEPIYVSNPLSTSEHWYESPYCFTHYELALGIIHVLVILLMQDFTSVATSFVNCLGF